MLLSGVSRPSLRVMERCALAQCRILWVMDPGFDLSAQGPWGLGGLLKAVKALHWHGQAPQVQLASRAHTLPVPSHLESSCGAVWEDFDFVRADQHKTPQGRRGQGLRGHFEQIWLFGSLWGEALSPAQRAVLRRFMDLGGGVLVTGHGSGLALMRDLPRVRCMRDWSPSATDREALPMVRAWETVRPNTAWADACRSPAGRPHPLLHFDALAAGVQATPGQSSMWIDVLPRGMPGAGRGAPDQDRGMPGLHDEFPPQWRDVSLPVPIDTVAHAPLGSRLHEAEPSGLITAFDGWASCRRFSRRPGRIVCDASALHFVYAPAQDAAVPSASGEPSVPLDVPGAPGWASWPQAQVKALAYVRNVVYWLQPVSTVYRGFLDFLRTLALQTCGSGDDRGSQARIPRAVLTSEPVDIALDLQTPDDGDPDGGVGVRGGAGVPRGDDLQALGLWAQRQWAAYRAVDRGGVAWVDGLDILAQQGGDTHLRLLDMRHWHQALGADAAHALRAQAMGVLVQTVRQQAAVTDVDRVTAALLGAVEAWVTPVLQAQGAWPRGWRTVVLQAGWGVVARCRGWWHGHRGRGAATAPGDAPSPAMAQAGGAAPTEVMDAPT